jgi:hypothetical protein
MPNVIRWSHRALAGEDAGGAIIDVRVRVLLGFNGARRPIRAPAGAGLGHACARLVGSGRRTAAVVRWMQDRQASRRPIWIAAAATGSALASHTVRPPAGSSSTSDLDALQRAQPRRHILAHVPVALSGSCFLRKEP